MAHFCFFEGILVLTFILDILSCILVQTLQILAQTLTLPDSDPLASYYILAKTTVNSRPTTGSDPLNLQCIDSPFAHFHT